MRKLRKIYKALADAKAKDKKIKALRAELEELEYKFAGYLAHTTDGRISKTYGGMADMIDVFEQVQQEKNF